MGFCIDVFGSSGAGGTVIINRRACNLVVMHLRLNKGLLIRVLVFSSDMCLEIVEPWPPLARRAVTGIWTRSTDIAYLVPNTWRCSMNGLSVTLEVVLCSKALGSGTSWLTASEWFGML